MSAEPPPSKADRIRAYHALSKHAPQRFAPGPTNLDWANQPAPFRSFEGAPRVQLIPAADALRTGFAILHHPGLVPPSPLDLPHIGLLLEISLGLSAWKSLGPHRWALRCNPSSGNLHPTEAYLLSPALVGLEAGIYHYHSRDHALERRARVERLDWDRALGGNLLLGLSSIHWREAWKYGIRAYRYCQHDVGHAIAALRYGASALGWKAQLLQTPKDSEVAELLGLSRSQDFDDAEPEQPDALIAVGFAPERVDSSTLLNQLRAADWSGQASRLSAEHREWTQIPQVASAARKSWSMPTRVEHPDLPPLAEPAQDISAASLFRKRRSAVAFDGRGAMPATAFFDLLDALLPRWGVPPWDALPWEPKVHPTLFVHRVDGLGSGLYLLARSAQAESRLRETLGEEWVWERPRSAPKHLRLWCLAQADLREHAKLSACHQDIAADSAFSVAMLADFDQPLTQGAFWYRRLFWECGILGQALYLRAEVAGLRGTGIGCFFDDMVHEMLGLRDTAWQDLYHFTVGTPIEDPRLETHPPYAHLDGLRWG
jgi:SagB-type dehydrogenase family enzyme